MAPEKRKRPHSSTDGPRFKRPFRPSSPPLTDKLTTSLTKTTTRLHKGLKLSRSIELKKLSRRIVTAVDEGATETQKRLEAEKQLLVDLNLRNAAKRLLVAKVKKDKEVRKRLEEAGVTEWKDEVLAEVSGESMVIVARLGNYRVVKEIMAGLLAELRKHFGLESASKDVDSGNDEGVTEGESKFTKRKATAKPVQKDGREDSDSPDRVMKDDSDSSDDAVSDYDMDRENNRAAAEAEEDSDSDRYSIAMSNQDDDDHTPSGVGNNELEDEDMEEEEEEDAGWETNSDGEFVRVAPPKPKRKTARPSDNLTAAEALNPANAKKLSKSSSTKETTKPAQALKPTKSQFLPTLLNGYISDPDSEASGDEMAGQPERKNRRGQRARRAIWEKKYGEKAKHKQKEARMDEKGRRVQGGGDGYNNKWKGADRGAQGAGGARSWGGKKFDGGGSGGFKKQPEKERKKDDDGKLHPSWLAAKKKKDEVAKVEFKGKKIVFD